MGETIYDDIKELAATLGEDDNLNEGDDNGKDDEGTDGSAGRRSVRGQDGPKHGERPKQGDAEDQGAGPDGEQSGENAPRDKSGASPRKTRDASGKRGASHESGKDAQGARGESQENGDAPQKDGKSDDGSVRGQDGRDSGSVEDQPEKPPTNADFAKQRRENRELRAKLAALEAAKPAPATPTAETKPEIKPTVETVKEPDKNVNYQEWLEWKLAQQDNTIKEQAALAKEYKEFVTKQQQTTEFDRTINAATEEFLRIEESYKKVNPDYGNAIDYAYEKYADAAKTLYPDKSISEIEKAIDQQMLKFAADCAAKGLNPAEELYDLAIERFGYTKAEGQAEEEAPLPQRRIASEKPNLKMISSNKKRSATPLAGGGQGGSIPLTPEIAADMSVGEFSRLTADELSALESM